MLKKRGRRRLWAVLGTMLLAAALGVCALAASDVPKAVLNARESVVRIMTERAMGSGFAVSGNSVYVVTNHHVIEGAETIEVIVDDTRWTTARVYVDLPGKDICILKTDKPLRGMPGCRSARTRLKQGWRYTRWDIRARRMISAGNLPPAWTASR